MEVAIGEGRSACKMEGRVVQRDQEDNYVEIEHHNSFIKADINFQALASKKRKTPRHYKIVKDLKPCGFHFRI